MSVEVYTGRRGRKGGNKCVLTLYPPDCSCGKWVIYHMPCSHMLAAAAAAGKEPWFLFAPQYITEMYARVYETSFVPILAEDYWPQYEGPIIVPNSKRERICKKGRPEHSRIHNEMDESRQTQISCCSLCKPPGHNIHHCPQRRGPIA